MKRAAAHPPELCARFHRASGADRPAVDRRDHLRAAQVAVPVRHAARRASPDITDRMLSDRLQELEQEGILERTVIPDTRQSASSAPADEARGAPSPPRSTPLPTGRTGGPDEAAEKPAKPERAHRAASGR